MKAHAEEVPPATACLDAFGDVLTGRDLCRLVQRSEQWLYQRRWTAKRRGLAPDLPAEVPGDKNRYRKVDVAEWLATGRSSARRRLA